MTPKFGAAGVLGMAVAAVIGTLAPALAQQGMGGGPGMMGGRGGGMMAPSRNIAGYLDALKSELGITAAQEPAWKEYADTVTNAREQMGNLHQSMFDAMGSASWEQRRDMMNAMFEARQQAYESVHGAAEKLAGALDADQQAKARTILPGLGGGRGMMRRHGPPSTPP